MKTSTIKDKKYIILSTVILLLLWKVISLIVGRSIIIPSPEKTFLEIISIIRADHFITVILNTFKRMLISFSLSFLLALKLGMISALFDPIYYLLKPLILIQTAVPTMAIILLALIWLSSELAPVLVGFLIIFPIIYSAVVQSVKEIDDKLLEMAEVYRFSPLKKFKKIYLPSLKSGLLSISSTAIGLNLKVIIAAEVLSQPKNSIGTYFQIERATLNTAGVFGWAIIVIAMAFVLDLLISSFERRYSNYESSG